MVTLLSLVTSIKDYIEIVHKLVETNTSNFFEINNYYDFGAILTYLVVSAKEVIAGILTFKWFQNIWSLPLIVPDVASAMISEISVLDGYLHNAFTYLDTPISYGNQNTLFYGLEKFSVGLINSIFLCLPTSTAHIITLRRFVMQGIEAGYLAGLGTLAGNILWIGSILFGLRFIVIPWLSFDMLRYILGFLLLVKYMWDSYSEKRTVLEDLSKWKIFLLNFLLAFTEQATIYPFLSNLSIGSDASILESFPTNSFFEYSFIHTCYLGGLVLGGLTLLHFACWFWENPAFNIYMWAISSAKTANPFSQKFVNLCFLYLTMFFTISNLSYFGLDYTVTSPLGFVHEDRLIDQKNLLETSFLNTKSSDRNTRRNRGRHGRRERWKRRVRRYRTFDASLYDQGVYDLFTIEDLNYGFDRFWLRRKLRNHRVRFRFFPGPWMRSFKKQLARPRLESFMGPRVEFFRILFEQAYHPEFHEFRNSKTNLTNEKLKTNSFNETTKPLSFQNSKNNGLISFYSEKNEKVQKENLVKEYSALRKFLRKIKTRTNTAQILSDIHLTNNSKRNSSMLITKQLTKPIYSKRWKQVFSKISHTGKQSFLTGTEPSQKNLLTNFFTNSLLRKTNTNSKGLGYFENSFNTKNTSIEFASKTLKQNSEKVLSKKDRQILRYKTFLKQQTEAFPTNSNNLQVSENFTSKTLNIYKPLTLIHPIQFYLQKEQAFQKKMKFYGASVFRNFGIENNAPYYRVMMKKFFYYYKPTLRWESTMRNATMRKARRKGPRIPRKLNITKKTQVLAKNTNLENSSFENFVENSKTKIQRPTHFYSLVSKRATRYRYQIYKDVLQHWYYSPFNRLLLKFDVDAFIRRQPTAHFFTKKEENLLHLKRFLLSDYYNTLRWYSYMQHYNLMKSNIGKTKSFANRSYNQQFFGTFKKIRHLFAITPSLSEKNILKFDQPLFNEYKTQNLPFNSSDYSSSVLHEELFADEDVYLNFNGQRSLPEDFTTQSTKILKDYFEKAAPIREAYIQKLIDEKNFSELTNFLFKGQKIRGTEPTTNQRSFLNQEKMYLTETNDKTIEKEKIQNFLSQKILCSSVENSNTFDSSNPVFNSTNLWLSLMKRSRNMLYNQEALKIYVAGRVEKLEKQKKRQQKIFQTRLENMKQWLNLNSLNSLDLESKSINNFSGLTTSVQKAIKEGIYYHTSQKWTGKPLEKSNLRNNREKIFQKLPVLSSMLKNFENSSITTSTSKFRKTSNLSLTLKNHLNNRIQVRALNTMQTEAELKETFSSIQNLLKKEKSNQALQSLSPLTLQKIFFQTLTPFKFVSFSISQKIQGFVQADKTKTFLSPFKSIVSFFTQKKTKNFDHWKSRENVLSVRKKIRRKIYRVLDQKRQIEKISNFDELQRFKPASSSEPLRQKRDRFDLFETQRRQKSWNSYENQVSEPSTQSSLTAPGQKSLKFRFSELFEKNFKRKRTRSRRYRRFKGRGPIKKHTLAEKLKRQFKLLKRYGDKETRNDKKMEIFQMITKRKYNSNSLFEPREMKQRRTRQSKHRYWKTHKRQKYLQVKRKQRKRRRYTISKLRVLNKEFKRIQGTLEIQKWWWEKFLPNFITTQDNEWELEKNRQIQEELSSLSSFDILKRDNAQKTQVKDFLQIGNQDFKPLSIPQALELKENLMNQGQFHFSEESNKTNKFYTSKFDSNNQTSFGFNKPLEKSPIENSAQPNPKTLSEKTIISQLSENLFLNQTNQTRINIQIPNEAKQFISANPIPFYAGWDENLRQFIITNRLLSRKDAGYSMSSRPFVSGSVTQNSPAKTIHFTKAPLQGMNAATTLYWQIPFTTYDPDQFFALGMDGFSPLAWRFFHFRHSQETTKPMLVKNIFYTNEKNIKDKSLLSYNIQLKMLKLKSNSFQKIWLNEGSSKANTISKNQARKLQKRQKRVKKHPRPPVWFPSGPLANQVLPVHYIYVFYKRTRLPRDRYIGRRLRRFEDPKANFFKANFTKIIDFTLRKRVKPIRKYHRKRKLTKNQENTLILRRRPFKGLMKDNVQFRPIAKDRLTTQTDFLNASLLKTKQRKKSLTNKQTSENLRIRQLRRRIQRQVLRPISRYKPRSGGFVWPGDYLRLEAVKAPTLNIQIQPTKTQDSLNSSTLLIRKKKRRNIQEWQIQPKKYLLEKHNLKVLKKRLQKSQNLHKFSANFKTF